MQIFYAPDISGNEFILDEFESRHCVRVMRMRAGTPVNMIDGKGNLYEGVISVADQKACRIEIKNVFHDFEKRPYSLHIGISPLKNVDRFEWFIEKSVEIGIDEITPVICSNTEKKTVKAERINNIIISAMKQSLKAFRTRFNNPVGFCEFISSADYGIKLIAHCNNGIERLSLGAAYSAGKRAVILIGPEGDFSYDEIEAAIESGFRSITLGNNRLRSETAGIVACHSVNFLNQ
jgi:16S rRNA (uracil1498-N3)-methyltransferase